MYYYFELIIFYILKTNELFRLKLHFSIGITKTLSIKYLYIYYNELFLMGCISKFYIFIQFLREKYNLITQNFSEIYFLIYRKII